MLKLLVDNLKVYFVETVKIVTKPAKNYLWFIYHSIFHSILCWTKAVVLLEVSSKNKYIWWYTENVHEFLRGRKPDTYSSTLFSCWFRLVYGINMHVLSMSWISLNDASTCTLWHWKPNLVILFGLESSRQPPVRVRRWQPNLWLCSDAPATL